MKNETDFPGLSPGALAFVQSGGEITRDTPPEIIYELSVKGLLTTAIHSITDDDQYGALGHMLIVLSTLSKAKQYGAALSVLSQSREIWND